MSRHAQIAIVALFILLCCCLSVAVLGVWILGRSPTDDAARITAASSTPLLTTVVPTLTGTATREPTLSPTSAVIPLPTSTIEATPVPPTPELSYSTTEGRLRAVEVPQRDIRLLAERLRNTGPIPEVIQQLSPAHRLGDAQQFWVGNVDTMEQFQVTAELRYETDHLYMWVEEGLEYDPEALARSAERFEAQTYPTVRAFFGSEWSPGVDGDPHLHVLHSTGQRIGGGVAGYYSSTDEYSRMANPYSNEREMFYVSLSGMRPGTDFYDGVLAHEFQHMVHWASDRNEDAWVNEGCSELAAYLNGYDPGGFDMVFVADPDVQLNTWPAGESTAAHYGASYLFMAYLMSRLGEQSVRDVVAHPANGVSGLDAVLAQHGLMFEDTFGDWLIANYLDNRLLAAGAVTARHLYPDHVVGPVSIDARHDTYPVQRQSTVHQYAADYVELGGRGNLLVEFSGDTAARLVPTDAHSGRYAWWSNRGDDSDVMLTKAFDLRSVDRATLQVSMWYDIEADWDYAYIEASVDGGETWEVLDGQSTRLTNPNGNSFGPAYTGSSDGWIEEVIDLGAYAGREVLVRFEYVTDDAVTGAGWLIDDIRIPELGYTDDLEAGPEGWVADGFVYSDNRVSQRYLVQLVSLASEVHVYRVPVDETGHGQFELRGLGDQVDSAVLVISALAPATTEVATYQYRIRSIE